MNNNELTSPAGGIVRPAPRRIALRTLCLIAAIFWLYVTLSNLLYAQSMQINATRVVHVVMYAPWTMRVVQHVLLFPLLLACFWASSRAGWGGLTGVPLQLILAGIFSALSFFAMQGAMAVFGWFPFAEDMQPQESFWALWSASFISFFLTYSFGVALLSGFTWYQRYRDSEMRGAALAQGWTTARLSALRMQLSPHTLFNLLHTIRGQIKAEPEIARSMVVQLADLLRRLLSAGQRDFSLLSEELTFVRLYLELQQQRFTDRLTVTLPDTEAKTLWVPSLILQPLVENAVLHGLAGHDGPVDVRVEVIPSANMLIMRVVNTGNFGAAEGEGIGLGNVRERLAVQFGPPAMLKAGPAAANTWVAEIMMPALFDLAPHAPGASPAPP